MNELKDGFRVGVGSNITSGVGVAVRESRTTRVKISEQNRLDGSDVMQMNECGEKRLIFKNSKLIVLLRLAVPRDDDRKTSRFMIRDDDT